jgi:hypothetical protein
MVRQLQAEGAAGHERRRHFLPERRRQGGRRAARLRYPRKYRQLQLAPPATAAEVNLTPRLCVSYISGFPISTQRSGRA